MNEFFGTLLPLIFVGYIISIGFGVVVAQKRGATAVNRFWVRTLRRATSGLLRFISWAFSELAKLTR